MEKMENIPSVMMPAASQIANAYLRLLYEAVMKANTLGLEGKKITHVNATKDLHPIENGQFDEELFVDFITQPNQ
jgi:hypothetical protein